MVSVATLAQHLEEQVELCGRLDHDLHRISVDLHVTRILGSGRSRFRRREPHHETLNRNPMPHTKPGLFYRLAKCFVNLSLGVFETKSSDEQRFSRARLARIFAWQSEHCVICGVWAEIGENRGLMPLQLAAFLHLPVNEKVV